jgi:hypothetical protein
MKPPPTSYTGSSTEWSLLSEYLRKKIRNGGTQGKWCHKIPPPTTYTGSIEEWNQLGSSVRYRTRQESLGIVRKKEIRLTPPPASYIGSVTDWKLLTKKQRSSERIKPPPDSYTGTLTEWKTLTKKQRTNIRNLRAAPDFYPGSATDWMLLTLSQQRSIRIVSTKKPCQILPAPVEFNGSAVDWAAMTSGQRYRFKSPHKRIEYKIRNKDKLRDQSQAYYLKNKVSICAYQVSYNAKNHTRVKERYKKWFQKNKDSISIKARVFRQKTAIWSVHGRKNTKQKMWFRTSYTIGYIISVIRLVSPCTIGNGAPAKRMRGGRSGAAKTQFLLVELHLHPSRTATSRGQAHGLETGLLKPRTTSWVVCKCRGV